MIRISGGLALAPVGAIASWPEPWRPSIHATWGRANPGTSIHDIIALVRSGARRMVSMLMEVISVIASYTKSDGHVFP